jgi:cell division protease FtsH
MLAEHREQLDALAGALLERETLDEPDAYAAAAVPHANHIDAASAPRRA